MNPWRSLSGLPRPVWVLAIATLVNRAGTMALPFMALYLTRARGLSAETAAAIIASYGVTSLVISPIAGRLSDRIGARRLCIAALVGSGIMFLLYPLATTLPGLVAMTMLLSLVSETFRPAAMALFGELSPPAKKKQVFALQRLAVNLGMTVGPAVGGLLAGWWFPAVFIVDGVTTLLGAIIMALMLGATAREQRSADDEPTPVGGRRAHADAGFILFLVAILGIELVFFQLDAAVPLFMVGQLGLSEVVFGLLFTINTVIIIFVEVPLNAWMDKWPPRAALALGALLITLGFSSMAFATGIWTAAATVVVWTFGEMILFPASAAYVSDVATEGRSGEYMGLYTMTFGIGFAVGPWAGVAIAERFSWPTLWLTLLISGLATTLLLSAVKSPQAHAPAARP